MKDDSPLSAGDPLAILTRWQARGWLRTVEVTFAGFLRACCPEADPWLLFAAALTSHQAGRGHVHLDLAALLEDPNGLLSLPPEGSGGVSVRDADLPQRRLAGIELSAWLARLDHPELIVPSAEAGTSATPLVRVGTRLYLRRLWQCEQEVTAWITHRLAEGPDGPLDPARIRSGLDQLLPRGSATPLSADWQRIACAWMVQRRFGIITGGPGTGKTTTVVRLLALLQQLSSGADDQPDGEREAPRIALAAPTGKAAARLSDAISRELDRLQQGPSRFDATLLAAIPRRVTTLHRLLGGQRDSRHFRHNAANPLWLDALVIDEASMVGLELMADLLRALPARARLYLIGDKDQLASVEAGALLGALCRRAGEGHYTPETAEALQAATGDPIDAVWIDPDGTPLDQAVVMLRRNFRFAATSSIGQLAQAVNAGDLARLAELRRHPGADLTWLSIREEERAFTRLLVDGLAVADHGAARVGGYRHYLEVLQGQRPTIDAPPEAFDGWAHAVLRALGGFQLLCALRQGAWGVEGLNARVEQLLRAEGVIETGRSWYVGRPVMVTRNDHALGLMNGDVGVTLELPIEGVWWTRVAFLGEGGEGAVIRWFPPSRLPEVETVFAMTVHKSQGSEFGQVVLVLPEALNPVLTREWLYTGITRAREGLVLVEAGDGGVCEAMVVRGVVRAGGWWEV
nr:Exodeoxyribonuclease V, alpha subunit [uncultured bacterium]